MNPILTLGVLQMENDEIMKILKEAQKVAHILVGENKISVGNYCNLDNAIWHIEKALKRSD